LLRILEIYGHGSDFEARRRAAREWFVAGLLLEGAILTGCNHSKNSGFVMADGFFAAKIQALLMS
jgi:hypothetical protein